MLRREVRAQRPGSQILAGSSPVLSTFVNLYPPFVEKRFAPLHNVLLLEPLGGRGRELRSISYSQQCGWRNRRVAGCFFTLYRSEGCY